MASSSASEYLTSIFGLKGKTVLITGGTRGIGHGLSIALASAGANIILLARNLDDSTVTSTSAAIQSVGRHCRTYNCDLTSRESVASIISQICITDGHEIDIFVHCAGVQHRAPAEDFPDEAWDDVLSVNLTAGFQLSRALAKHWLSTSLRPSEGTLVQRKKIIFVASVLCFTGSVEVPAYAASKGAVGSLTRALSNEWMAKGINVNAIAPGYFETKLTAEIRGDGEKERHILGRVPAGRWGDADTDLDGTIVHLASRASDFVGGVIWAVDGGFCAR